MARTKHVFDSRQCAHVWAQQTQDHGRNGKGTLYFDGATIYSYGSHFPIARFVTQGKGSKARTAVLFTTRTYSVSTARHIRYVRNALAQSTRILWVENPASVYENARNHSGAMQVSARYGGGVLSPKDYFARQIKDAKAELLRKRAVRSWDRNQFDAAVRNANSFAEFFGLRWRVKGLTTLEAAAVDARENITRERDATRDERRAALHAKRNREWQEQRERAAINRPWHMVAWLAGSHVPAVYSVTGDSDTLLRVNGDVIETTRGAKFPVEHGRRAFALIKAARNAGREWVRNGHAIHLGHFQIDRITAGGDVHAGCHFVRWQAIEFAARQLGLIEGAAE